MQVYYNEWDEPTAAWLRELGAGHHLPSGHIDTRSIRDVHPDDVAGYDQCHFFAGIGGWPLALRWAGLKEVPGIWTGSPPCQPFSVAGKGLAQSDERHLAPVWLDLVKECRPAMLFGEQVADAIGKGWLDDLFDALEREGYACGAAVLPACSVGAPHIRKRLFFGAVRLADRPGIRREQVSAVYGGRDEGGFPDGRPAGSPLCRGDFRMANPNQDGCKEGREIRSLRAKYDSQHGNSASWVADADDARSQGRTGVSECTHEQPSGPGSMESGSANSHNGGWENVDWVGCRDGKFRPVESQVLGMANGISSGMVRSSIVSASNPLAEKQEARVLRVGGYGNAISPQLGADFITEFLGAFAEMQAGATE